MRHSTGKSSGKSRRDTLSPYCPCHYKENIWVRSGGANKGSCLIDNSGRSTVLDWREGPRFCAFCEYEVKKMRFLHLLQAGKHKFSPWFTEPGALASAQPCKRQSYRNCPARLTTNFPSGTFVLIRGGPNILQVDQTTVIGKLGLVPIHYVALNLLYGGENCPEVSGNLCNSKFQ